MDFLLIAILTLINGAFAMSEMALTAAKKVRLTAMAESAPMTRILGTEDVGRWRLFRLPLAQEHPEGDFRLGLKIFPDLRSGPPPLAIRHDFNLADISASTR